MAADIGPGTPLICIRWEETDCVPEDKLTIGALYTVRGFKERPPGMHCSLCHSSCDGVKLKEKHPSANYCPCLFRPLNDGDTSLVEDMEGIEYILDTHAPIKQPEPV